MINKIKTLRNFTFFIFSLTNAFNSAFAGDYSYKFTPVTLPDGGFFIVSGINNSGVISGYMNNQTIRWKDGAAEILPALSNSDFGSVVHASINNLGQIAASSVAADGVQHTVVWNGSTLLDLGAAGSSFSRGFAINSSGQVAGSAIYPGSNFFPQQTAVVWKDGVASLLGSSLAGVNSIAYGINDAGVVVGYECVGNSIPDACSAKVWKDSQTYSLKKLGGNFAEAYAINNAGQIAGTAMLQGDNITHAVRWDGEHITDLGTLGGDYSYARSINSSGKVVGAATGAGNVWPYHASLWDGNKIIDLNSFLSADTIADGWVLASAVGINDRGDIIGVGYKNGASFSFLLSAVPEPSIFIMLCFGMVGIAINRAKKGT